MLVAERITAVRRSRRHYPLEPVTLGLFAVDVEKRRIDAQLIARQTGQDLQKVLTDMERDFWMSADEAIKYGLVSKVIESSRDLS